MGIRNFEKIKIKLASPEKLKNGHMGSNEAGNHKL